MIFVFADCILFLSVMTPVCLPWCDDILRCSSLAQYGPISYKAKNSWWLIGLWDVHSALVNIAHGIGFVRWIAQERANQKYHKTL